MPEAGIVSYCESPHGTLQAEPRKFPVECAHASFRFRRCVDNAEDVVLQFVKLLVLRLLSYYQLVTTSLRSHNSKRIEGLGCKCSLVKNIHDLVASRAEPYESCSCERSEHADWTSLLAAGAWFKLAGLQTSPPP